MTSFLSLPYFLLLSYLNLLIKKTLKTPFDFSFLGIINLFDHSSSGKKASGSFDQLFLRAIGRDI